MRTKTMLLSALLGSIGSVSVMSQTTNVYSLNAVGYINVTMVPGYNIVTCPLIASPTNTIAVLLNNTNGQFQQSARDGAQIYAFGGGTYIGSETANANDPNGWSASGTNTINPGQAIFFFNPTATNMTATFVGTVPTGSLTNTLIPGYNLVGSIVPVTGDIVTNTLSQLPGAVSGRTSDYVYLYNPGVGYEPQDNFTAGGWSTGDPTLATAYQGFFYFNSFTNLNWVENFSVGQ